jgi:hypothetical protein
MEKPYLLLRSSNPLLAFCVCIFFFFSSAKRELASDDDLREPWWPCRDGMRWKWSFFQPAAPLSDGEGMGMRMRMVVVVNITGDGEDMARFVGA